MLRTNKFLIPYVVLNATILLTITVLGLSALEKDGVLDINIGPYADRVGSGEKTTD